MGYRHGGAVARTSQLCSFERPGGAAGERAGSGAWNQSAFGRSPSRTRVRSGSSAPGTTVPNQARISSLVWMTRCSDATALAPGLPDRPVVRSTYEPAGLSTIDLAPAAAPKERR